MGQDDLLPDYQRILLIIMALGIAVFGVITAVSVNRLGIAYGDSLLFPRTEGTLQIYEGEVDGEAACFIVSPDMEVSYQWGDYLYGPYQILEDPSAVPETFSDGTGVEIRQGEEVLFRGVYSPDASLPLIDENGEPVWEFTFSAITSSGDEAILYVDGQEVSQQERHTPSLSSLLHVAFGPELTHRGSAGYYLLITLLAVLNILQICFPGFFFRLSLLDRVQNLEDAEPSDLYLTMEHLEWAVLAVACLVLYIGCCSAVMT